MLNLRIVCVCQTLRPAGQETVQCLPLFSITRALNMNHINLFSLDVEGAEMDVLKTIPWGALTFTVRKSFFSPISYERIGSKKCF
jgi:hypothetical protein